MSRYRIVCVETEHPHRHITHVGVGDNPSRAADRLTIQEVRAKLRGGDRFHTVSPSTGKAADVRADDCRINGCTIKTIRSAPDAVKDNNLDEMRACRF